MKERLISDLEKLKDSTKPEGFLYKRYTLWINIIKEEKEPNSDFIKFLYAKSSHTDDESYSLFLTNFIEKTNENKLLRS